MMSIHPFPVFPASPAGERDAADRAQLRHPIALLLAGSTADA